MRPPCQSKRARGGEGGPRPHRPQRPVRAWRWHDWSASPRLASVQQKATAGRRHTAPRSPSTHTSPNVPHLIVWPSLWQVPLATLAK